MPVVDEALEVANDFAVLIVTVRAQALVALGVVLSSEFIRVETEFFDARDEIILRFCGGH